VTQAGRRGGALLRPVRRWRDDAVRRVGERRAGRDVAAPGPAERVGPAPRPEVVAALASDRLVALLADEWSQRRVDALAPDVRDADALLVEWTGGAGTAHDLTAQAAATALAAAATAGVPSVLWDTARDPAAPLGPHGAQAVRVDDEQRCAAYVARGDAAQVLGPTFSARRRGPQVNRRRGAAHRHEGAVRPQDAALIAATAALHVPRPRPTDARTWDTTVLTGDATDGLVTPGLLRSVAAGSVVVTTSQTVAERVPGVIAVPDEEQARWTVTALARHTELRDRTAHRATRAALAGWSSTVRASQVLEAAGRGATPVAGVSAVVATMRPERLDDVLDAIARQEHPEVELVLVTHGFEVPAGRLAALAGERGLEHVRAVPADSSLTLGACMNLGVDAADGTYVAKMDDDNFYGRHYLADLVAAFGTTSAQVVGKWAHLTYLESTGTVLLRFPAVEHRYTRLVQGGTILVEREVARAVRFEDLPRRVDTTFLDKVRAQGGRVYAADRFGFVSVRSARTAGHTWRVSDAELLAKPSRILFYGEPWEYADV
jgi:hypothetical protein